MKCMLFSSMYEWPRDELTDVCFIGTVFLFFFCKGMFVCLLVA